MKKMKIINKISKVFIIVVMILACTDENNLDFLDSIVAPSNVSAAFNITQDNTGLVTITPIAEGATSFEIDLGDGSPSEEVKPGNNLLHTYAEGTYNVTVIASNIKGDTTEAIQELMVSFQAPQNLVVTIENDAAVSKKVNITATAEYASMFEFYSGEDGVTQPVGTANIGDTFSYQYTDPGTYSMKVIAKGGAIETTEYTEDFEVTEISAPLTSASTPQSRDASDVISIYSSAYTNVAGTNVFPDWGQGPNFGSSWAEFDLSGDLILQYVDLSYQGIEFGSPQDVSAMEYIHLDVWTKDVTKLETSLISATNGEKPVWSDLTLNGWTSIDIPLSDFTSQGLTVADIHQLKFTSEQPWPREGTVFIDNIYFYKKSTTPVTGVTPIHFESDFELSSFDGGDISVVANPDTNGNSSSSVAQLVKDAGQPWAGSKITIPSPFNVSNTTVTAKVWSPRSGLNLLLKFEDATPWPNTVASAEVTATTTIANGWEELTFDFSGIDTSVDFTNLVLIMDNGTQGDGSSDYTIYVDDISTSPKLDFEPDFELSSFDGGDISVVANPDTNGNTSLMVAQLVKDAGQPWAGSKITVPTPFSFSGGTSVRVKVWSPRSGLNLLLKFEDATPWPNTVASAEVTATTTIANGWEELTFDFSGIDTSIDYTNLVLIMDNGTQGDGSSDYTIYLDDISQF